MQRHREVLAIIPARGGSKGIPHKNVAPIAGRPLLAYTVEHAKLSSAITRVIVSTDDDAIAVVARDEGAEVVRRPADISGDTAASETALLHVLQQLRANEGYEPDLVVFLQATSPIRAPNDIENAVRALDDAEADSLFSACATHGFVWRREEGSLSSFSYDYRRRPRRQDAPEELVENGSIYVFKPWVLHDLGNRLGGVIGVYLMDPLDSFQVDEPRDLQIAEQLLRMRALQPIASAGCLSSSLANVKLLVLDFDGVLTDNRVLVDEEGREAAWCSRGDGFGIAQLRQAGIDVLVLSSERATIAAARSRKLGISCVSACEDKLTRLVDIAQGRGLSPAEIAYVGNDLNDLHCMKWVGVPVAVADAQPEVLGAAAWVTAHRGGHGAVREITDELIRAQAGRKPNHCNTQELPVLCGQPEQPAERIHA